MDHSAAWAAKGIEAEGAHFTKWQTVSDGAISFTSTTQRISRMQHKGEHVLGAVALVMTVTVVNLIGLSLTICEFNTTVELYRNRLGNLLDLRCLHKNIQIQEFDRGLLIE
jgi:hypothetical protein